MTYVLSRKLYDSYAELLGAVIDRKVFKKGKMVWEKGHVPAEYPVILKYLQQTAGILGEISKLSIDEGKE